MSAAASEPPGDRRARLDRLVQVLPAWQLAALHFNEWLASELGVVPSDLHCLFVLDRGGPSAPGAIAAAVGLTTGSASRMVERLVRAGLVSRRPDGADRRRVVVEIEPAASRRLHAVYDPLDEDLRGLLDDLDDRALAQLERFVGQAIEVTAARSPGRRPPASDDGPAPA